MSLCVDAELKYLMMCLNLSVFAKKKKGKANQNNLCNCSFKYAIFETKVLKSKHVSTDHNWHAFDLSVNELHAGKI